MKWVSWILALSGPARLEESCSWRAQPRRTIVGNEVSVIRQQLQHALPLAAFPGSFDSHSYLLSSRLLPAVSRRYHKQTKKSAAGSLSPTRKLTLGIVEWGQ